MANCLRGKPFTVGRKKIKKSCSFFNNGYGKAFTAWDAFDRMMSLNSIKSFITGHQRYSQSG